jgi:DNA-binding SARP family transcriptional activator
VDQDAITIRLLGGFGLSLGDAVLESLPPQAVLLLSYLAVNRDRSQTRDLLAGRFWSELPEDRARKRLSNTLWQIKSAATEAGLPELLETTSNSVRFTDAHPVSIDVEEFENALNVLDRDLRNRQLRAAFTDRLVALVATYAGDFLAGYYHDWIEPERDRLRDRYHGSLTQLIQLYKARSEYDVALRFAATLVKQEPLREDLHREVMRLHALLGQIPAAERQYAICAQVLDAELGVDPSAETLALIERIRSDAPSTVVAQPEADSRPSALIGRIGELQVLLGRVDELLNGTGGVVLVEGDPGIGKTRLMDEFAEGAEWRGVRVINAGHTELSKASAYQTLRDLLADSVVGLRGEHLLEVVEPVWLRKAAEVLPDLARLVDGASTALNPDEEPSRVSEALARVVLAQGGLGPTMVVLEDIHWCDDDSMQVLVQLGSRLAASGVLLCLTYRRFEAEQSQSVWSGISRLEAMASASRLVIGPLTEAEVRELITSHLGPGGLPAGTVGQLIGETNGNPLYVLESVRNPGSLTLDGEFDHHDPLGGLDMPASVLRSLESRVSALDPDELEVLRSLASLAEPASARLVGAITGLERKETLEALNRMIDRSFVVDDDDGVCRFVHDQTRRVVYQLMSPIEQTVMHGQIYRALDGADGAQPARLAYHARLAGDMAGAHRWHLAAARAALDVNGYRTAADHYGQADAAADELAINLAQRAGDLLAYESALDVLGRRTDQTMLLKRLREVELPLPLELELAKREVWLMLNSDEPEDGARLAMASVERAKEAGEGYAGLLTAVGVARYRAGDYRGAIEPCREAMEVATDPADRLEAQTTLGKALVDLMEHEVGLQHLTEAAQAAEESGNRRAEIEAVNYLAVTGSKQGRFADAERLFGQALELSRSIGYRWGEWASLVNLAATSIDRGQGGRALDFFVSAAEVFGALDHGRGEAIVKVNTAELYHRLIGNDAEAADLASSAAVYFRSIGDQPHECVAMCVLSSVDRRHGRRRLARKRLNDLLSRASATDDANGEVEVRRVLAGLEVDGGDWRAAATHLDRIMELGQTLPLDTIMPNVLALRGLVALTNGRNVEAEEFVNRALARNAAGADQAHVTAWTCGEVLRRLGQVDLATDQFKLAFELLTASLDGLPPDMVDRAWTAIDEHARIAVDYEKRFVSTMPMHIPAADAPMGRSLHSDEYVDVVWTVADPSDWAIEHAGKRRQHRLQRLTEEAQDQGGSARIADLAVALGVSERTIKRDLADLRATGVELRTRKSS